MQEQMAKGPYRFDSAQFYAELQKQNDIGSCASLFKTTVAHFGFDTFSCGEIDIAHRDRNVFYIIEWPESWRKFYIGSGLIERDPLLGALSARRKSFTWSELRKERKLSQVEQDALRLAAEHGWTEGLAVSVTRGGTRYGLVSLVGHSKVSDYQRLLLCLISECLLTRIRSLQPRAGFPAPPAGLSKREIDCLRLVALGCSDREIADTLGISRSTAHQHVEGGRRKLSAKTRAHLAALGVSLGIIGGG
jgi:LuxR family quorum sensing-dependent transcriptional regulator